MLNKTYFLNFYLILTTVNLFVLAKKELQLLHVLSANKFYVPDYNYSSIVLTLPNNFTYKYFLENSEDIPSTVKVHLFYLGAYLRDTYNGFIPSLFTDNIIEMRTTAFSVSIIAGELVNTGLWPPVGPQIWNEDLLWQPIPFVYDLPEKDTLLLGTLCPNFQNETSIVLKNHNFSIAQKKLFHYLINEGQIKVTNPMDVSLLYLALENSNELNQIHPDWLKKIFPSENLLDLSLIAYDLLSTTTIQKKLNGGSIIKAVIENSKKHINKTLNSARKINIYSGDERNLAGVLKNLNIPFKELPNPGAALIFELFVEDNNYFIKINYYTGSTKETIPYTLDGCDLFCPLEKFSELVADVLPDDELSLCGSMIKPVHTNSGGTSTAIILISNILFSVMSLIYNYITSKHL